MSYCYRKDTRCGEGRLTPTDTEQTVTVGGLFYNNGEICTYELQSSELFSITINYFYGCDYYIFMDGETMFSSPTVLNPRLGQVLEINGATTKVFMMVIPQNIDFYTCSLSFSYAPIITNAVVSVVESTAVANASSFSNSTNSTVTVTNYDVIYSSSIFWLIATACSLLVIIVTALLTRFFMVKCRRDSSKEEDPNLIKDIARLPPIAGKPFDYMAETNTQTDKNILPND